MAISDAAQRNHDAMFPDHRSTLKLTDPELVEIFDNWAFDEVMRDAPLDPRIRLMVQLAAIVACQAVSEYRVMLGAALHVGVTPIEVKEIIAYSTDRERGFHTIVNTGVERLTGHRCFTQVFTMGQGRPSGRRF